MKNLDIIKRFLLFFEASHFETLTLLYSQKKASFVSEGGLWVDDGI